MCGSPELCFTDESSRGLGLLHCFWLLETSNTGPLWRTLRSPKAQAAGATLRKDFSPTGHASLYTGTHVRACVTCPLHSLMTDWTGGLPLACEPGWKSVCCSLLHRENAFVHRIHFMICQFVTCQETYKKSRNEEKVLGEICSWGWTSDREFTEDE